MTHLPNGPEDSQSSSSQLRFFRTVSLLFLIALSLFFSWKGFIKWKAKAQKDDLKKSLYIPRDVSLSDTLPPLSQDCLSLLSSPYIYMAKGKQAVTFASVDGKHVLKVIKWPRKKRKRAALAFSVSLAATRLSHETGMIGIAYGPLYRDRILPQVRAMNHRGKMITIDLHQFLFVLQEKAPYPLKDTLLTLKWKNNIEEGKAVLQAVFQLLDRCREKEVIDLDGALIRNGNIALLKSSPGTYRAIYVDIGKFALARKEEITSHDIKRLRPFSSWIMSAWPELHPFYIELQKEYRKKTVRENIDCLVSKNKMK